MCSLSHIASSDGFQILFNRDEKLTRGREQPPIATQDSGVTILAPRDSDFGGTWIAVNDRGVAVAILNGYRAADGEGGDFISRGALVLDLAACDSRAGVLETLHSRSLDRVRSFVLAVAEPGQPMAVVEWDRVTLAVDRDGTSRLPLFSSSFRGTEVAAERRRTFHQLGAPRDLEGLLGFHRSHLPARGPYSVCMHRDDAATRSFTLVTVTAEAVELAYRPAAPCEVAEPITLRRPRVPRLR